MLEPGTLAKRIRDRTAHALDTGALAPLPTESHVVEEGGIPFVVRVLSQLAHKERETGRQRRERENPFLRPDPDLYVADLSPTHIGLLNKFFVVADHLLIVTRTFESQEEPLTAADFEALWLGLLEIDGIGFYNAGAVAGASQPHKHLQLVPAPLGEGPERAPVERVLGAARFEGDLGRAPALPCRHGLARLGAVTRGEAGAAARESLEAFGALRSAVALHGPAEPYNLLVTRDWMLLVPRCRERWEGISVNALGFAGSLLVRDRAELERVRAAGPLTVLRGVASEP